MNIIEGNVSGGARAIFMMKRLFYFLVIVILFAAGLGSCQQSERITAEMCNDAMSWGFNKGQQDRAAGAKMSGWEISKYINSKMNTRNIRTLAEIDTCFQEGYERGYNNW